MPHLFSSEEVPHYADSRSVVRARFNNQDEAGLKAALKEGSGDDLILYINVAAAFSDMRTTRPSSPRNTRCWMVSFSPTERCRMRISPASAISRASSITLAPPAPTKLVTT